VKAGKRSAEDQPSPRKLQAGRKKPREKLERGARTEEEKKYKGIPLGPVMVLGKTRRGKADKTLIDRKGMGEGE